MRKKAMPAGSSSKIKDRTGNVSPEFARWVEKFIKKYKPALLALAKK